MMTRLRQGRLVATGRTGLTSRAFRSTQFVPPAPAPRNIEAIWENGTIHGWIWGSMGFQHVQLSRIFVFEIDHPPVELPCHVPRYEGFVPRNWSADPNIPATAKGTHKVYMHLRWMHPSGRWSGPVCRVLSSCAVPTAWINIDNVQYLTSEDLMSNLLDSLRIFGRSGHFWPMSQNPPKKSGVLPGVLPDGFSQDSARGLACSSQNVTPSSQTTTLAARTILDQLQGRNVADTFTRWSTNQGQVTHWYHHLYVYHCLLFVFVIAIA